MPRLERISPAIVWLLLLAVTLATRVPLAIDETRYLTVAWEMFSTGQWLVPHLNGDLYTHKPPLLAWLIGAGWGVFGVGDWWPRLLPWLVGTAALLMLAQIARRLWPDEQELPEAAVLFAAGALVWVLFSTLIMFDLLLTLWVLVGALGLLHAGQGRRRGWLLFGAALGLGILTKGPVALVHLVLPALAGPWWSPAARASVGRWYLGLLGGIVLGAAVALAWVVPAALAGGPEYTRMILWSQTAERVTQSFAHQRPWWWYLPVFPLVLLPWTLWGTAWRAAVAAVSRLDDAARFCVAWILPVFLAFSAISGKQPHYLLPVVAPVALLVARGLGRSPAMPSRFGRLLALLPWMAVAAAILAGGLAAGDWHRGWLDGVTPLWGLPPLLMVLFAVWQRHPRPLASLRRLCLATLVSLTVLTAVGLTSPTGRAYGVGDAAAVVARLQQSGVAVGYYGNYHGQLGYAGRLAEPVSELMAPGQLLAFAKRPASRVLVESRDDPRQRGETLVEQVFRYRTGYWSLWRASDLAADPSILSRIRARAGAAGLDG